MSVPVLTFLNNKGGVGKTSLAYHLAWMLSEQGTRVLAVDLDPQANLTAAFLDEDRLEVLWEQQLAAANTIFRCVRPLLEVGDLRTADMETISPNLALIPGDLALAGFEDQLSAQWSENMGDSNLVRSFRMLTAFWQIAQAAASRFDARVIIFDAGPNLDAINRSALIATDHVVIPLGADLFSLQWLRNLGPILRSWRSLWEKRLDNWTTPTFTLPRGHMRPVGYIVQQHGVRLSRPVKAYNRWMNRIPEEYRRSVLDEGVTEVPIVEEDPYCLALLKHYHSLVPLAQEARKPMFALKVADGAIGAHANAVQSAYGDFQLLADEIMRRIGMQESKKGAGL